MRVIETEIPEVKILEPHVYGDSRGFFFESYNRKVVIDALGLNVDFVQDNHSQSTYGTLRGLHYQLQQPQGKLVRVISGAAFDVAVDMRKKSKTFGKWVGIRLSAENKQMLWIPPKFAHGFITLTPNLELLYKTTDYYDPSSEYTVRWDDPDLAIPWPLKEKPILSLKDSKGFSFKEAPVFP